MDRVAVRGDRRDSDQTVFVLQFERLTDTARAALRRFLPGLPGVVDPQRHIAHAVSVDAHMLRDVSIGTQRGGQHEAHLPLLQNIRSAVADTGFRPGISDELHAKGEPVKIGGLAGIAHPELHVVRPVEWQKILLCGDFRLQHSRHNRTAPGVAVRCAGNASPQHTANITIYPGKQSWPVRKLHINEATDGPKVATQDARQPEPIARRRSNLIPQTPSQERVAL